MKKDAPETPDTRPEAQFWSASGLARVAELIEQESEIRGTQVNLASAANMSSGTLKNLRMNDGDKIRSKPDPDTLIRLAPHITNPETRLPFLPEELLAIARGAIRDEIISIKQYVYERLEALGLTLEEAAQRQGIPLEILERFIESPESLDYAELSRVIIMFGSALGSSAPIYLAQLCGIDLGFDPVDDDDDDNDG